MVHMTAQCCGRRRVRDEKQREGEGALAEHGKQRRGAVNGSCMQKRAVKSGRQAGRQTAGSEWGLRSGC